MESLEGFHSNRSCADLIRSITDPEHPITLENLLVVSQGQVTLSKNLVNVEFTPTVPHCGAATIIGKSDDPNVKLIHSTTGLCIRVRLLRSLPDRFKVDITIKPGTHQSERAGMHRLFVNIAIG